MIRGSIVAAVLLMIPAMAGAQETAAPVQAVAPVSTPVEEAAPFSDGALAETDLAGVTGREDIARSIASASQRNTVANNSVSGNSVTGNVAIDGNAFQNLQGLAVINANSGNNVAINSAMNVTVNLAPAP